MDNALITFQTAEAHELPAFKKQLQDAFGVAVIENFGALPDGPIPADEDLDESFTAPGAEVLHILRDGERVGGVVVAIDATTQHNALELLFLTAGARGRGLGQRVWRAIEQRYPATRVWETHTPYFERRNIHFYVNVCGFKAVEFFNAHHPDPYDRGPGGLAGTEGFRFEKVM